MPTIPIIPLLQQADKVKDSVGIVCQRYLIYGIPQIPASFNGQDAMQIPNAIMTAIRAYSNEPGFTPAG